MKIAPMARTFALTLAASLLGASTSLAYVDIELEGGRHVKGESYSAQAGKLVVYKPSGAVEIDRSTVRSIREVEGSLNEPAAVPAEPPAAAPPPAPAKAAVSPPAASSPVNKDPKERENELARQLMFVRLDRLAASQRGDQETLKKLDKEIGSLQKERIQNYKKIDPSFEVESSK
jgi:hypothetical protein